MFFLHYLERNFLLTGANKIAGNGAKEMQENVDRFMGGVR